MSEIPRRIATPTDAEYLAVITRAVFQAGLSWHAIGSKWDAYEQAFDGFEPAIVAHYDDGDIERIMARGDVVRSRKKIAGTIANARALLSLARGHGGIRAHLRSFDDYDALAADVRARFAFLGDLSVYYVLFRTGERVPRFEDWEATIPGDHPRMREMIALARSEGWTG